MPAIVTPELFQKAHDAIHKNQIKAMAHASNEYLLSGKIVCGLCGLNFTGRGNKYGCNGRHCAKRYYGGTKPPCTAPYVYRKELEDFIWEMCELYICRPDKALDELERDMANTAPDLGDEIRKQEDAFTRNATAREKARSHNQLGYSRDSEFLKDMQRLMSQKAAIETRLAELRMKSASKDIQATRLIGVRSLLEQLRQGVKKGFTFAQRQRIVDTLVEKITVQEDGQERIDFRFHFEGPGWKRGISPTKSELKAGAAGLRIALDATGGHTNSTGKCRKKLLRGLTAG